jgi:hypothetical protein
MPTKSHLLYLIIILLLAACSPKTPVIGPTQTVDALGTIVAATLTAAVPASTPTRLPTVTPTLPASPTPTLQPTNTPLPTSSPTPAGAKVSGKVCYPGGKIPAMNAYFQVPQSNVVFQVPIATGQITYTVTVTPGTFIAYAWLPDFSRGGLYSKAVPCGMKSGCTDHATLPFTVKLGDTLTGIDLCDWYAGPFNLPYPPGKKPAEVTGSISGSLSYSGGSIPALRVVAFNINTKNWYWVGTLAGEASYTITGLPPGTYHAVAYDENGKAGGYADSSHKLIDVTVKAGETASADINDWQGIFPSDPTR